MTNVFNNIVPQTIVDELCAEYRRLHSQLGSPKYEFAGWRNYLVQTSGREIWQISKYFRNVAALTKFEVLVNRLDYFFIGVEYFNGEVELRRTRGTQLKVMFLDEFFVSILADTFRSAMDIYAQILGCFFDLPNRDGIGFSYKNFIVPLKQYSVILAEASNSIYKSHAYRAVKDFRDKQKHRGMGQHIVDIGSSKDRFEVKLSPPPKADVDKFTKSIRECLEALVQLIRTTVSELEKWGVGYDSPNDKLAEACRDGTFRWFDRS